jgi:hypothetical protein
VTWKVAFQYHYQIDIERELSIGMKKTFFSYHKYFGEYVVKYKNYPTMNDYLLFLYKKSKPKSEEAPGLAIQNKQFNKRILPIDVEQRAQIVFQDFETVMDALEPMEFMNRFQASIAIEDRIRMEKGVMGISSKFNTDQLVVVGLG